MPNWISGGLLCPETESITDRGHHFALGNNNVWDSARISDFHSSSVLFWCFRISPLTLPGYSYLLYHLFYANKSCRSNSVLNLFFFFFYNLFCTWLFTSCLFWTNVICFPPLWLVWEPVCRFFTLQFNFLLHILIGSVYCYVCPLYIPLHYSVILLPPGKYFIDCEEYCFWWKKVILLKCRVPCTMHFPASACISRYMHQYWHVDRSESLFLVH